MAEKIEVKKDQGVWTVSMPNGELVLKVEQGAWELEELCGFGCRANAKRGFLFVSRVLGKHIPVKPSRIEQVHRELAEKIPLGGSGPGVVIAMAETATCLGQGVYEKIWNRLSEEEQGNLLFVQGTRYRRRGVEVFEFEESHSHASRHLCHVPPNPRFRKLFWGAQVLYLVDDEISTGNTLANLVESYRRRNPGLQRVVWICLTDWMGEERLGRIRERLGIPLEVVSLLRGQYDFLGRSDHVPMDAGQVESRDVDREDLWVEDTGRLGQVGPIADPLEIWPHGMEPIQAGRRGLVLGTGEFAYPPFRWALELEKRGYDMRFQTTTRSPILVGGAILKKLQFSDNYFDGIPNYLYNYHAEDYDWVVVGYELRRRPEEHDLRSQLGQAFSVQFTQGIRQMSLLED